MQKCPSSNPCILGTKLIRRNFHVPNICDNNDCRTLGCGIDTVPGVQWCSEEEGAATPGTGGQGAQKGRSIKNGLWVPKILATPLFASSSKFPRYATAGLSYISGILNAEIHFNTTKTIDLICTQRTNCNCSLWGTSCFGLATYLQNLIKIVLFQGMNILIWEHMEDEEQRRLECIEENEVCLRWIDESGVPSLL